MQPNQPGPEEPSGPQPPGYGPPGQSQPGQNQPGQSQPSGPPFGGDPGQQPYGSTPPGSPYGSPAPGQPFGGDQGQQPYSAAGLPYGAPGAGGGQAPNNTLGLVSLILGIVAIPMVCCFYLGIPIGIGAIVTGFMGKKKAEQGLATNRGQALAGLSCGAAAIVLGIILVVLIVVFQAIDMPTNYGT